MGRGILGTGSQRVGDTDTPQHDSMLGGHIGKLAMRYRPLSHTERFPFVILSVQIAFIPPVRTYETLVVGVYGRESQPGGLGDDAVIQVSTGHHIGRVCRRVFDPFPVYRRIG